MTWSKLTEVNIELRRYTDALLTLNSCPMFTYNERDLHRMPTPSRTHLPTKAFIHESGILASLDGPNGDADANEADVALLRLPGPNLKGTWKKAYELLAKLVGQIGWDELLKARSEVFVMEEEYRMQKQTQDGGSPVQEGQDAAEAAQEARSAGDKEGAGGADDDASVRAVRQVDGAQSEGLAGPHSRNSTGAANGVLSPADEQSVLRSPEPPASPIPEIRISRHSEENPSAQFSQLPSAEPNGHDDSVASSAVAAAEADKDDATKANVEAAKSDLAGPAPGVEKPASTHLSEAHDAKDDEAAKEAGAGDESVGRLHGDEQDESNAQTVLDGTENEQQTPTGVHASFVNKRLCERWLDNLFMVLYEVSYPRKAQLRA